MDRKSQQGHPEMSEISTQRFVCAKPTEWRTMKLGIDPCLGFGVMLSVSKDHFGTQFWRNENITLIEKIFKIKFNLLFINNKDSCLIFIISKLVKPWIIFRLFGSVFSPRELLQSVKDWERPFHFKRVIVFHNFILSPCRKKFPERCFWPLHNFLWECSFNGFSAFEWLLIETYFLGSSGVALLLSFVVLENIF